MKGFSVERMQELVIGHDRRMARQREEWDRFRAAHDGRMWEAGRHRWTELFDAGEVDDPLPVKVQVNLVKPFVQRHKAALFYRNPRTEVVRAAVSSVRTAAAMDGVKVDALRAVGDDWLRRKDVQQAALHALGLALMYPGAAFKAGWDVTRKRGSAIDRVFLDVIPCWEVMWDERAKLERQQRYRAHIRYEPEHVALELVGMTSIPEGLRARALPDFVRDTGTNDDRRDRDDGYLRVLEFYDCTSYEQKWALVDGIGEGARLFPGDVRPFPYEWADGTPASPLVPVVLEHVPEHPFEALPPVREVYENASEQSLLLSITANAMRVDSARVMFFLKGKGLSDEVIGKLRNSVSSLEFIEVDANTLEGLTRALDIPSQAASLDKYKAFLDLARQDSTVTSDLGQGRQGKYLSATEAQVLSAGDEQASSEPQSRMAAALGRCAELAFRIMAAETKGVTVRVGREMHKLSRADLAEPWTIYVVDAASSPTKALQRQQQFLTVQKSLLELASMAAEVPQAPGAPAAPPVPPSVRALARAMLDYAVALWDLPESFRWDAISVAQAEVVDPRAEALVVQPALPAPPAEMVGQAPAAPEVPSDDEIASMFAALTPEQRAQLQAQLSTGGA